MPPRRSIVVVAGVVAAILTGGTAWLLWPEQQPPPPTATADAVIVRNPDDPGEAQRIQEVADLVEGLPAAVARGDITVWSAATRERFADVSKALPPGSTITVDRASWRRTGAIASVDVTVGGPNLTSGRYRLITVHEDGAWRVSGTMRLEQP